MYVRNEDIIHPSDTKNKIVNLQSILWYLTPSYTMTPICHYARQNDDEVILQGQLYWSAQILFVRLHGNNGCIGRGLRGVQLRNCKNPHAILSRLVQLLAKPTQPLSCRAPRLLRNESQLAFFRNSHVSRSSWFVYIEGRLDLAKGGVQF